MPLDIYLRLSNRLSSYSTLLVNIILDILPPASCLSLQQHIPTKKAHTFHFRPGLGISSRIGKGEVHPLQKGRCTHYEKLSLQNENANNKNFF
jgi:hypothetical protein